MLYNIYYVVYSVYIYKVVFQQPKKFKDKLASSKIKISRLDDPENV